MNTDTDSTQEVTLSSLTPVSLPPTSLIICSRNRPKLLLDCVLTVLQGDEVPNEIIVIDDSNAPHENLGWVTTNRPCELRYTWTQSVGLSRANNDGIAAARYDLLVFTQDDVLVTPKWFGTIVRALIKAGQRTVVTGKVLAGKPEAQGGFAPSTIADDEPKVYEGRIDTDVLYIQNMAMYRSTIGEVGRFDQRLGPGTPFPGAEDNDFGFRLLKSGYRILYEPRAVTCHRAWRSDRDHVALNKGYGCGQGAYYAKHLSLRDRYMLRRMGRDVKNHILEFVRLLWRRPSAGSIPLTYAFGLVLGATRWWWSQRRRPPW